MSDFEPEPYNEELEFKDLDVWQIIETYFRDNPNYKSQHQVDSFNEFIHSKTNGIEYIIKRENPILPHPRMHIRKFVLLPLRDIEPEWKHTNYKININDLILRCDDNQKIFQLK